MSMTKEQVKAARGQIEWCKMSGIWTSQATTALDALCAAASQPDLVGRRVAVRAFGTALVGTITKESRSWTVKHSGSQAGPCAPGELTLCEGDDFELLEGDDGK